MRQLAVVLIALGALAFVVGTYCAFAGQLVVGRSGVTYWRGAVGFAVFAISLLQLQRGASKG